MTASIKRIVYGVLAVLGAIVFVPGMCAKVQRSEGEAYNYERFARPNEARIRAAIEARLAERLDPACVLTARLPYDSSRDRHACDACDALADAGLLDKSVAATPDGTTAVRFDLTDAGRALYREDLRDRARQDLAGLCFGRTVLDDLTLKVTAVMTDRVVHARYVTRIDQPHALLYGPHAQPLRLPQLSRGHLDGTRQPAQFIGARLDANHVFQSLE